GIFSVGLLLSHRTVLAGVAEAAGALAAVVLLSLLVPNFGIIGAGIALVGARMFTAVVMYLVSQRFHPIGYDLQLATRICLPALALTVAGVVGAPTDFWPSLMWAASL